MPDIAILEMKAYAYDDAVMLAQTIADALPGITKTEYVTVSTNALLDLLEALDANIDL